VREQIGSLLVILEDAAKAASGFEPTVYDEDYLGVYGTEV
jgi:hypothetical protein